MYLLNTYSRSSRVPLERAGSKETRILIRYAPRYARRNMTGGQALDSSLSETWAFFRRTQPEELGVQTRIP
jgi:hypothetical protein